MGVSPPSPISGVSGRIRYQRVLVTVLLSWAVIPAVILLARRFAGEYTRSPRWPAFLVLQGCGVGIALVVCHAFRVQRQEWGARRISGWSLSAGLLAWGLISIPWPLGMFWGSLWKGTLLVLWWAGLGLLLGETSWPERCLQGWRQTLQRMIAFYTVILPRSVAGHDLPAPLTVFPHVDGADAVPTSTVSTVEFPTLHAVSPESLASDVFQGESLEEVQGSPDGLPEDALSTLTRWRTPEGEEVLSGQVEVECPCDQIQTNLHLSFLPPFAGPPEMIAEVVDSDSDDGTSEATVRVGLVTAFGARLEVIRRGSHKPEQTVLVEFEARHPG